MYDKHTVLDYLSQYSQFNAMCLYQSEEMYQLGKGFSAVIVLFNCLENVSKSLVNDYNSNLCTVFKKLLDREIISEIEHDFLNKGEQSIRKIRNLYAHANITAIHYVNVENGKEVLWPLTENDTSILIYRKISDIVFNLILKIVCSAFIEETKNRFSFNLEEEITNNKLFFKELSFKELLVMKGYPENYISEDMNIPEAAIYRIIDNSPNVKVLESIFSGLFEENYEE